MSDGHHIRAGNRDFCDPAHTRKYRRRSRILRPFGLRRTIACCFEPGEWLWSGLERWTINAMHERTFYGWRVVGAAFVLAVFGWGLGFYGPPVYLHAVQRGARLVGRPRLHRRDRCTSWSAPLVVANLPALYRRFGLPTVTKAGAAPSRWACSAGRSRAIALAAVRSPRCSAAPAGWRWARAAVNAIVAPWFVRTRPAALAMAYNGASIGGVVFSPLWVVAIAWLGLSRGRGGDRFDHRRHDVDPGRLVFVARAAPTGHDSGRRRARQAGHLRDCADRATLAGIVAVARPPIPHPGGRHGARAVRTDRVDRAPVLPAGAGARGAAGRPRHRRGNGGRDRRADARRLADARARRSTAGGVRQLRGADRRHRCLHCRRRHQRSAAARRRAPVRRRHRQRDVVAAAHRPGRVRQG